MGVERGQDFGGPEVNMVVWLSDKNMEQCCALCCAVPWCLLCVVWSGGQKLSHIGEDGEAIAAVCTAPPCGFSPLGQRKPILTVFCLRPERRKEKKQQGLKQSESQVERGVAS